ncbi:MAG: orotate phosphoribosyltransferase [Thermoleophilia bacterium]|nr:orotate phosphoribosyltransferase [Thermoleophilia bacterium]
MPEHDRQSASLHPAGRRLFERALLRGTFTLRSGQTSDRYFDKYRVSCDPVLLALVADELATLVAEHAPEARRIVAPALGAVPLAAALALRTGLPFAIVRETGKEYGTANRIEGPVEPGETALLIEDVVTSGGAALDALAVAREAGLVVTHTFCVLDRDSGGREALADADAPLIALLGVDDLDAAFDAGVGIDVGAAS